MSSLEALKVLQDSFGPAPANAIAELVRTSAEEVRADVMTRVDEKVAARYAEIHRRVTSDIHEAVAPLHAGISGLRAEMHQLHTSALKALVAVFIIQFGMMVVLAWATKHLF